MRDDADSSPSRELPTAPQRPYDSVLVFLVGVLMVIGVVMVYSAQVTLPDGAGLDSLSQWRNTPIKQLVFTSIGFVAMIGTALVSYRIWRWDHPRGYWKVGLLLAFTALLVLAMYVPSIGYSSRAVSRAVRLPGGFTFQPAEAAKIALVLWLAAFLTSPHFDITNFKRGFCVVAGGATILVGLIAKQDLGTGVVLGMVMVVMLYLGGARKRDILLLCVLGLLAAIVLVVTEPYRLERIMSFIQKLMGQETVEQAEQFEQGRYQINQALIAIGSGSWWGRGLGGGIQKYGYVPMDDNDMILATICEELGIIGGLVVIALFLVLLMRGWWISAKAPDSFGKMLAIGITITLSLQALFNILVVTDSVPTKGISLPFVSAGGSGVIFLGVAAGLLASVGRREQKNM